MAPLTPTLEDWQSQITSDVDFSEWLCEDDSAPSSPDSDFVELFSRNTMHLAASGGSHWRAVDWYSLDDLSKPELSEVEDIEQHQEPAKATEANATPETAPQEPAYATLPELTSQLAAQGIITDDPPVVAPISEKLHSTEYPATLQHNDLPTKTGLGRKCAALSSVIDLTGPEPVFISEMPSSQPKDDRSDIVGVQQGCGKKDDDSLAQRVNVQNPNPRKRPASASSGFTGESRRKTTVQKFGISNRLFTSAALKENDNLMEAQSTHFEAVSKHFETSQHFEDTVIRLMTLRALIDNHGAMEEEATEDREHQC